jgi:hypothetical protein
MRRWVRYRLPVMVCVDIDEHHDQADVTQVVVATDHQDITLDRDYAGGFLVYDQDMHRIADAEPAVHRLITAADARDHWPPTSDWDHGPDARRRPTRQAPAHPDPPG